MICLKQALFIAKQRFQLQVHQQKQLIEKGPRYLIILCDLRHFPVDALMQPSQSDHLDTGLGIYIRASGKLHCVASGWWGMSMNRKDSIFESTSYYHRRFPGNCQLEFERCRFSGIITSAWGPYEVYQERVQPGLCQAGRMCAV